MKKLYTLLLLVIGLTANAQDGDFDVLTHSIYTYGTVVNGGHAIEKTYRPTFDVTFVDGYWNYKFGTSGKMNTTPVEHGLMLSLYLI